VKAIKTILVTGGAGYIGVHTLVQLHNAGYKSVVVDNFSNSNPIALKRLKHIIGYTPKYYELDLLNKKGLEEVFKKHKFEAVIHLAGLKAVGESVVNPIKYYMNNIMSSVNLLEVMKVNSVKNILNFYFFIFYQQIIFFIFNYY